MVPPSPHSTILQPTRRGRPTAARSIGPKASGSCGSVSHSGSTPDASRVQGRLRGDATLQVISGGGGGTSGSGTGLGTGSAAWEWSKDVERLKRRGEKDLSLQSLQVAVEESPQFSMLDVWDLLRTHDSRNG